MIWLAVFLVLLFMGALANKSNRNPFGLILGTFVIGIGVYVVLSQFHYI